jgi:hypothetical protein
MKIMNDNSGKMLEKVTWRDKRKPMKNLTLDRQSLPNHKALKYDPDKFQINQEH